MRREGGREGWRLQGIQLYAPTKGNGRVIGWGPGDCREGRVVPALKEPPTQVTGLRYQERQRPAGTGAGEAWSSPRGAEVGVM